MVHIQDEIFLRTVKDTGLVIDRGGLRRLMQVMVQPPHPFLYRGYHQIFPLKVLMIKQLQNFHFLISVGIFIFNHVFHTVPKKTECHLAFLIVV
jgi:hypothetical protein